MAKARVARLTCRLNGAIASEDAVAMRHWLVQTHVAHCKLLASFAEWRAPALAPRANAWNRLFGANRMIRPEFLAELQLWKRHYLATHTGQIDLPEPEAAAMSAMPQAAAMTWQLGSRELVTEKHTQPTEEDQALREALISYRKRTGINLSRLAAMFGVGSSSLHRLEQPHIHDEKKGIWSAHVVRDAAHAQKMMALFTAQPVPTAKPTAQATAARSTDMQILSAASPTELDASVYRVIKETLANRVLEADMTSRFAVHTAYHRAEKVALLKTIDSMRHDIQELHAQIGKRVSAEPLKPVEPDPLDVLGTAPIGVLLGGKSPSNGAV